MSHIFDLFIGPPIFRGRFAVDYLPHKYSVGAKSEVALSSDMYFSIITNVDGENVFALSSDVDINALFYLDILNYASVL